MNKILKTLVVGIMMSVMASSVVVADKSDPIKIAINDWTGQHLSARIAGAVLTNMGYKIEYVTAGAVPQFVAMADGSLHFTPEVWDNNLGNIYPKAVKAGDLVVVGDLGLEPEEAWYYPPYMEDKCPGLPSYQALYDCAQAFSSAETFPNGRLITYPADWGTKSKDLVANLGLPFQAIAGGSEGAMLAEMKSAVAAKQPMLMIFWKPHWIHAVIELNALKWDASSGDCVVENQSKGNACGFPQANVKKVVNKDFAKTWPDAYRFLQAYELSNDIHNALILKVDEGGQSVEEAVAEWMSNNKSVWKAWIGS